MPLNLDLPNPGYVEPFQIRASNALPSSLLQLDANGVAGWAFTNGPNPSGGADYYVDGNTVNTVQDGASWATAFDTVAEALAASHARIGTSAFRSWAVRNRIFCVGDALVEDLTKLAQKTDVIGVGQCDGQGPGARIQGNHVIDTGAYIGCRFFNVAFLDNDATGTILTVPQQSGALELHNCNFLTGTATVIGLQLTAVTDALVANCRFLGSWTSSFSTAAAKMLGACHRFRIVGTSFGNTHATGVGLLIDSGFTANGFARLQDCVFNTTAMALNDAAAALSCIDNRFIVGTVKAVNTSIVYSAAKSAGNLITGSDGAIHAPVTTD